MLEISDILEVRKHIEGLKAVIFDLDDTLYISIFLHPILQESLQSIQPQNLSSVSKSSPHFTAMPIRMAMATTVHTMELIKEPIRSHFGLSRFPSGAATMTPKITA